MSVHYNIRGYNFEVTYILLTFLVFPCLLRRVGGRLVLYAAFGPFEDTATRILSTRTRVPSITGLPHQFLDPTRLYSLIVSSKPEFASLASKMKPLTHLMRAVCEYIQAQHST
jgi:hypothetical protein